MLAADFIRREGRLLVLVFCAALATHVYFATFNWNSGFLPGNEFRQAQTAITSYYIEKQNNFSIRYETPILGKPWVAVPLEFPLYEWSVVLLSKATGLPHFKSARTVSLTCFYLTLPAIYLLLGALGLTAPRRLLTLALILTCPLYIFYSRAFLMESMVLMFSAWFLLAFVRTLRERRLLWLGCCALSGTAAGLVKSTTFLVWLLPAALYGAGCLWRDLRSPAGWKSARNTAGWSVAAVTVPCAMVCWWIIFTDAIKAADPSAYILTSRNISEGNYGMFNLGARFSAETWRNLLERWHEAIMAPWMIGGLVLAGAVLAQSQRARALGAAALFLVAQALFPFAYATQEYYFYACAVFLLCALGFVLHGVLDSGLPRWTKWVILAAPFAAQLANYWQGYHVIQSLPSPGGSGLTEILRDLTPKGSVLIVAGADWSAIIPYNAQRKALMIRRGLEHDTAYLDRAFADLAGEDVCALILAGEERADAALVQRAAARFNLVTTPTFSHSTADVYMREFYQDSVVLCLSGPHGYNQITLRADPSGSSHFANVPEQIPAGVAATAFSMIFPAPSHCKFTFGYHVFLETGDQVLSTHPDSDLWLTPPDRGTQILWEFGIFSGAYEREGEKSDGVEFIVMGERPDGTKRQVFRRLLNPAEVSTDRNRQHVVIPYRRLPDETLVFSTRPNGNNNFDWAYWARVEVK